MKKREKKAFKALSRRERFAFVERLVALQAALGGYRHFAGAYRTKCAKKGKPCPLDEPARRAA